MTNFIKYSMVAAASFAAGIGAKVLYDTKSNKDIDYFDEDETDFFSDTDEAIAEAEEKFEAEQEASKEEEETSSGENESPEE